MLLFFFLRLYHTQRIYIFSIYLTAEIQMIAGGTSCGSDIRDNLSLLHMIAFFDSQCGTMQIHRLYTVSMVDGDIISKA